MASFTYNQGALKMADRTIDYVGATIKVLLVGLLTPYTPDIDATNLTAIAASEIVVPSGYQVGFGGTGRKTLANKSISVDMALNRIIYDADDPSAWTLGTGDTVTAAVVYYHNTSDAASIPLFYLDGPDIPTNGGSFTLQFPTTGIAYTQQ